MPSLGELFIELGVVGDTKELERLDKQLKEVAKKADDFVNTIKEEIEYNDKLEEITQKITKATQELAAAETEEAKAAAQGALAAAEAQKKRLEELKAAQEAAKAAHNEVDTNQKAIDGKKALAKNIAGVVKGVGVFVGAITGAAAVLNKFTNDLVQTNQAMLDLTRNTDIAQGTFQKWGNIGKMLGVENAEQQLESLNQRLFEMSLTGQGAEGFMLGGINPVGQDAEGVLEQLRQRVSGMNDTTATYLLQKMGLDPRMLHLLRMSRQEFESLGETIRKYQLSPEDTRRIQAMNIQLQIAGIKLRYLKDKAVMALMPAWTAFMGSLARVAEGLEIAVKWVTDLISKSPQLQSALKGVAAALAVILAITQPLWAALAALYLIIDDVMAYFNGGGSMIGVFIKYLDDLKKDLAAGDMSGVLDKLIGPVRELSRFTFPWVTQLLSLNDVINQIQAGFEPGGIYDSAAKYGTAIGKDLRRKWGLDGTPTGGAAPIGDAGGAVTGGAASLGYVGTLPNLENMFITPAAAQNIASSSIINNNDSRSINQTISIQTNQPAFDIGQQLAQARFAAVYGW